MLDVAEDFISIRAIAKESEFALREFANFRGLELERFGSLRRWRRQYIPAQEVPTRSRGTGCSVS